MASKKVAVLGARLRTRVGVGLASADPVLDAGWAGDQISGSAIASDESPYGFDLAVDAYLQDHRPLHSRGYLLRLRSWRADSDDLARAGLRLLSCPSAILLEMLDGPSAIFQHGEVLLRCGRSPDRRSRVTAWAAFLPASTPGWTRRYPSRAPWCSSAAGCSRSSPFGAVARANSLQASPCSTRGSTSVEPRGLFGWARSGPCPTGVGLSRAQPRRPPGPLPAVRPPRPRRVLRPRHQQPRRPHHHRHRREGPAPPARRS